MARARSTSSSADGMLRRRIAAAVIFGRNLTGARGGVAAECASGGSETIQNGLEGENGL
jgi:hypothetical protein